MGQDARHAEFRDGRIDGRLGGRDGEARPDRHHLVRALSDKGPAVGIAQALESDAGVPGPDDDGPNQTGDLHDPHRHLRDDRLRPRRRCYDRCRKVVFSAIALSATIMFWL